MEKVLCIKLRRALSVDLLKYFNGSCLVELLITKDSAIALEDKCVTPRYCPLDECFVVTIPLGSR